ncbi:hypothetical protein At12D13_49500 (plasmid) [Agrobacterium fabrum]|nr:hypothetical protein At12D13_49500 [Agrobacterium fabrum]
MAETSKSEDAWDFYDARLGPSVVDQRGMVAQSQMA